MLHNATACDVVTTCHTSVACAYCVEMAGLPH